jgi:hypothetical protein
MEGDTSGIKIVSLAGNPSMISLESRLKECIKENEELKEKLRSYEQDTLAVPGGAAIFAEKKSKKVIFGSIIALAKLSFFIQSWKKTFTLWSGSMKY